MFQSNNNCGGGGGRYGGAAANNNITSIDENKAQESGNPTNNLNNSLHNNNNSNHTTGGMDNSSSKRRLSGSFWGRRRRDSALRRSISMDASSHSDQNQPSTSMSMSMSMGSIRRRMSHIHNTPGSPTSPGRSPKKQASIRFKSALRRASTTANRATADAVDGEGSPHKKRKKKKVTFGHGDDPSKSEISIEIHPIEAVNRRPSLVATLFYSAKEILQFKDEKMEEDQALKEEENEQEKAARKAEKEAKKAERKAKIAARRAARNQKGNDDNPQSNENDKSDTENNEQEESEKAETSEKADRKAKLAARRAARKKSAPNENNKRDTEKDGQDDEETSEHHDKDHAKTNSLSVGAKEVEVSKGILLSDDEKMDNHPRKDTTPNSSSMFYSAMQLDVGDRDQHDKEMELFSPTPATAIDEINNHIDWQPGNDAAQTVSVDHPSTHADQAGKEGQPAELLSTRDGATLEPLTSLEEKIQTSTMTDRNNEEVPTTTSSNAASHHEDDFVSAFMTVPPSHSSNSAFQTHVNTVSKEDQTTTKDTVSENNLDVAVCSSSPEDVFLSAALAPPLEKAPTLPDAAASEAPQSSALADESIQSLPSLHQMEPASQSLPFTSKDDDAATTDDPITTSPLPQPVPPLLPPLQQERESTSNNEERSSASSWLLSSWSRGSISKEERAAKKAARKAEKEAKKKAKKRNKALHDSNTEGGGDPAQVFEDNSDDNDPEAVASLVSELEGKQKSRSSLIKIFGMFSIKKKKTKKSKKKDTEKKDSNDRIQEKPPAADGSSNAYDWSHHQPQQQQNESPARQSSNEPGYHWEDHKNKDNKNDKDNEKSHSPPRRTDSFLERLWKTGLKRRGRKRDKKEQQRKQQQQEDPHQNFLENQQREDERHDLESDSGHPSGRMQSFDNSASSDNYNAMLSESSVSRSGLEMDSSHGPDSKSFRACRGELASIEEIGKPESEGQLTGPLYDLVEMDNSSRRRQ